MMAIIFEFWLNEDYMDEYNDVSATTWQSAREIEGFISIEDFISVSSAEKRVAIAYFTDEEAVKEWRNHPQHRRAQALGRVRIYNDYRLIAAEVVREYTMTDREQAPEDSLKIHTSREN